MYLVTAWTNNQYRHLWFILDFDSVYHLERYHHIISGDVLTYIDMSMNMLSSPFLEFKYIRSGKSQTTAMFKFILLILALAGVNSSPVMMEDINCANSGNEVVFYPHPWSCQSYLTCYFGQLIEGQCGYGLYFDLERQICEAQARVRCVMPGKRIRWGGIPIDE